MSPAVVCTPMLVENLALRGVLSPAAVRTGLGPRRSLNSATALATGDPAILVAGLAGALQPDLRPGEVVVATDVVASDGRVRPSRSAPLLANALRRWGLTVHLGRIVSSDRIVFGAARTMLADTGALAVDMESAELAAGARHGAFAALRAVVDTPDAPLLRPGTIHRGLAGLRSLRGAAPAIEEWTSAVGAREIVLAAPGRSAPG